MIGNLATCALGDQLSTSTDTHQDIEYKNRTDTGMNIHHREMKFLFFKKHYYALFGAILQIGWTSFSAH